MAVYDFFIKQGDTQPPIEAVLADVIGPVNLTGATVAFKMRLEGTTTPLKVNQPATVVDAGTGAVKYGDPWQATDTDTAGIYEGEFQATLANGSISTFPNDRHLRIKILAAVG